MRRSKRAAVITAAFLTLGVFAPPSASSQELVSQVVCEATGWVFLPAPPPTAGPLDSRTTPISLFGAGPCEKPAVVPGDTLVFNAIFFGSGTTTRTGPCLFGVISQQDIFVTLLLIPANPPGPPGPIRTVEQLWTTQLNVGSPTVQIPSVYPPTHFQIRHQEFARRYSLRGAGAYTEPIGPDCPPAFGPPPPSAIPSLFAFTFTGGDAQP